MLSNVFSLVVFFSAWLFVCRRKWIPRKYCLKFTASNKQTRASLSWALSYLGLHLFFSHRSVRCSTLSFIRCSRSIGFPRILIATVHHRCHSLDSRPRRLHRRRRSAPPFIVIPFGRQSRELQDKEIEYELLYETNLSREDQNRKAVRDYLLERAPHTLSLSLSLSLCRTISSSHHCIYVLFILRALVYLYKYICGILTTISIAFDDYFSLYSNTHTHRHTHTDVQIHRMVFGCEWVQYIDWDLNTLCLGMLCVFEWTNRLKQSARLVLRTGTEWRTGGWDGGPSNLFISLHMILSALIPFPMTSLGGGRVVGAGGGLWFNCGTFERSNHLEMDD